MQSNFWAGSKNLDRQKNLLGPVKGQGIRDTSGITRSAFYAIIETHHFFQDTIDGCLPDDILPVILVTSFWFASFGLG